MSERNVRFDKFNYFENLKLDSDRDKNEAIHDIIQEDKQFVLNFFASQPYYKEMIPKMQKANRGTVFYRGLIKKGVQQKSAFFKAIMKSIQNIKEEKKIKIKSTKNKRKIRLYKLPKIDELKIKKKKIENNSLKKIKMIQLEKEKLIKYREQIKKNIYPSTTINSNISIRIPKMISPSSSINFFNNNNNNIDYTNNSFYKNGNSTAKISQNSGIIPYNNKSTYYKSINFKNLSRNESFLNKYKYYNSHINTNLNYLVNKCIEEIMNGKEVKGKVSSYDKNISKTIQKKLKLHKIINKDKKIIEERNKKNDKYMKLEEINYKNIKRNINQKISNSLAYRNRKELIELLKTNKNAHSYMLHLNEIDKINKAMGKKRIIERKMINRVKSLCDLGFKKNEFLNNKIDNINNKNNELKKLNKTTLDIPNDGFYTNNKQNHLLKGDLVPKLISLKSETEKIITVGDSLVNSIK